MVIMMIGTIFETVVLFFLFMHISFDCNLQFIFIQAVPGLRNHSVPEGFA
jgi:hypothetical protein